MMKKLILSAVVAAAGLVGPVAAASAINPATTSFPWMNGPARDSVYRVSEHSNTVHVFEAYSLSCGYCNANAAKVAAMSQEYTGDARVQFIDLGLDTADRDYQRWIATHTPPYPVVKDVSRTVWNALTQTNGIPQTFVVACDGTLTDYTIGEWGGQEQQTIRDAIAKAKLTTCP